MSDLSEPPPLIPPATPPPAALRVALGLVLYGFLDLAFSAAMAFSAVGEGSTIHFNLVPTFALYWVASWLVWKNKRVIWPILAYLSAFALGGLLGSALGIGVGLPAKLIAVAVRHMPFWFEISTVYGLVGTIFAGWLLFECVAVRDYWPGGSWPRTPWLQPRACLAAGLALGTAATWGILALLQASWTDSAIARAREQCGEGYDYFTINYQVASRNGQTDHQAVVLAYSETEFKTVPLHWAD